MEYPVLMIDPIGNMEGDQVLAAAFLKVLVSEKDGAALIMLQPYVDILKNSCRQDTIAGWYNRTINAAINVVAYAASRNSLMN